MSLDIEV